MHQSLLSGRTGGAGRPAPRAPQATAAPRAPRAPTRRAARRTVAVAAAAKREYQVTKEERADGSVRLSITVPGPLVQRRFTEIVDILRRDVVGPLKGYRPDKIPLGEIVSRVGGQGAFKAACLEHVLLKGQEDIMPLHAARMLPGSERIVSDVRALVEGFDPAKALAYEVEYDTLPPIRWARPYRDIEVSVQETGSLATDEAAVADLIRQYRKEKGQQRVVAGRGLQPGDVTIIDMRITMPGSSAPLPGLDKERFALDTEADPLGLAKGMQGMVAGEEREWDFTFPDDWHVELWRGKGARASVRLRELLEWDLPEFDDDFVKAHYPSFESAEDMRTSLLASTAMERFKEAQAQAADAIMEAVAGCVDVDLPEAYVRAVAEREFQGRLLEMVSKKEATPQQAEAMATEEGLEEFMREKRGEIEERCRYLLAADAIAEAEGLEVEAQGVDEEVERAKQQHAAQGLDGFDEELFRAETLEKLRYLAVMEWLQANVKINTLPFAGGEAQRPAAAAAV